MSTHQGSCHCGQVQFEITAPVDSIVDCNCSICVKKGIVHIPAQDHELKILRGEEHLSLYQFKSNTAYHWFCTHCGIHTFGRPRSDPTRHTRQRSLSR